jgi:phage tail-like protein
MTCIGGAPTFRLLDGLVGWDIASFERLDGATDPSGIRLMPTGAGGGIPPEAVWPYMPPPRLAYDCASCTWLLVTPAPPPSRVLQLGSCGSCDKAWREMDWVSDVAGDLVAVAVHSDLMAVADRTRGEVRVLTRAGALVGLFSVQTPTHLVFASPCELIVVSDRRRVERFDPSGPRLGEIDVALPAGSSIEAVAAASDGAFWILVADAYGKLSLERRACTGAWADASLDDLRGAFTPTGLVVVLCDGFCILRSPRDRNAQRCCFSWFGRPAPAPVAPPPSNVFVPQGQLLTEAVDSGRPRCRWHRVRVDADVPSGTLAEVSLATAETRDATGQGQTDPGWAGFAAGTPHPLDWQVVSGTQDFLINQPPGRYLYVRVRLSGDGIATPVVRSIRLDFSRATSVDALPAVYREDPRSEDFTERFVALFDAALEDVDAAAESFPALLDVADTPEDVLPWLGRFLGAAFDPTWDAARRRRILEALPRLYEQRGTLAGLSRAVRLVFDVDPVIEEVTGLSVFGAVAAANRRSPLDARLGAARLFGRSRVRFHLGASALSRAPLRSYGDASLDPLASGAFRFRVFLPAVADAGPSAVRRVQRLVDSQKPAHTVASVSVGSNLPVLTGAFRVGIDTRLGGPPAPVLGARGNVRLGRDAILRGHFHIGPIVGHTSVMPSAC